ncbi:MAG: hypothetical protein IT380_28985 [Myxococcales bacterium]|nr:hypothetical protein [Myxococcales bacterium]
MNDLIIELVVPALDSLVASTEPLEYEEPDDDYRVLLVDACEVLARDPRAAFRVKFCGEQWRTDLGTDLAVLLEQIPAIAPLPSSFTMSFFEQTLERELHFEPHGHGSYRVSCTTWSRTWRAPTGTAIVARDVVAAMLETVVSRFVEAARVVRPQVTAHPRFLSWFERARVHREGVT